MVNQKIKSKKIALVLSGGGARGLAHIGVIEELERQGYEITSLAGTSMGAVVGGMHALGKLEEYKNWMYSLDKVKVLSLVDFTFSSQGLVKGDRVFNKMREFISDENIEDLNIPYAAVSVDLRKQEEVVFKRGSIYNAIRASVSIPTVFTPVKKRGKLLVDGGVLNNIPIDHVKRTPGDILVVSNVNAHVPVDISQVQDMETEEEHSLYKDQLHKFQKQLHKILPSRQDRFNYFNLINNTIHTMTHRIAQMTLEKYHPEIIIKISHESCGLFDFYKAKDLVEIGRNATKNCLLEKS